MAEVSRLVQISSENFKRLDRELKLLVELNSHAQSAFPRSKVLKKLEKESRELYERFFVAAVPLADTSVATALINETIKSNLELRDQLESTKDWIMSTGLVQGNEYLDQVKINPEDFKLLELRNSQTAVSVPAEAETQREEPPKDHSARSAPFPETDEEGEFIDDDDGIELLGRNEPSTSAKPVSTSRKWSKGFDEAQFITKPRQKEKKESYLIYKEEDDRATATPLSKPLNAVEKAEEDGKTIRILKSSVLKLRHTDETRTSLLHGVHKSISVAVASLFFLLPFFSKFSVFPVWVVQTGYSVATTYSGSSIRRCFNEVLGSGVGAALGYGFFCLIALTGDDCIQCSYKPYLIWLGICLATFCLSTYGNIHKKWEQVCDLMVSSFLLIVGVEYASNSPDSISARYALDRSLMIMAGVLIAFVSSYLIFPVKGSKKIHRGLRNTLAADFGFVISNVIDLYSNPAFYPNKISPTGEHILERKNTVETESLQEAVQARKKAIYSNAASVFGKTSQMRTLMDTTKGEVVLSKSEKCRLGLFPGDKYTTILFCTNQLMYITLTLFYGLQGGAIDTSYCHLFSRHLDTIRHRFEKMFVDISRLLDTEAPYVDVLSHIQVVTTLLQAIGADHKENLKMGITLKYSFDDVQAFFHLWTCLKLYLRKTTHLVDSIMKIYSD